jgi:fructose-1,6-bisphosphatase/sedoheptulose 1,7-bisphosphatase-like protein
MAKCLERDVEDLVIVVLDRARHRGLVDQIRRAGARIRLISDGDLSAGIAAAVRAPEGVLTAAALRCLGGEMLARLVIDTPELQDRIEGMGISDPNRIYTAEELAPGAEMIFAACGVTAGALLNGVRFFAGGHRTHSIVMTLASKQVRFIDTVHLNRDAGPRGVRLY